MSTWTNRVRHYPDMKHETVDWRELFSENTLKKAAQAANLQVVAEEHTWMRGKRFSFPKTRPIIVVQFSGEPEYLGETWRNTIMSCTCQRSFCEHMAAALTFWEKSHGPWIVWEREYDYHRRKEKEALDEERRKRDEAAKKYGLQPVPVLDAFKGRSSKGILVFDMERLLEDQTTTPAAIARMKEALKEQRSYHSKMEVQTSREGRKTIAFEQLFENRLESEIVWGWVEPEYFQIHHVRKEKNGNYSLSIDEDDLAKVDVDLKDPLDEYELAMVSLAWNRADQEGRAGVTDDGAEKFFASIRKISEKQAEKEIRTVSAKPEKQKVVELLPRIVVENGDPVLSMKIGSAGFRKYVVKDCFSLIDAVEKEKPYVLGKRETLDFSTQDFTESAAGLYDFIKRNKADPYAGSYQVLLKASRLDNFYDMYQGGVCELLDKTNKIKDELVQVGHMDIRFTLRADRLADARGNFIGITVSGFVPVLISGSSYKYALNTTGLSRISAQEKKVLDPFIAVADAAGYFRFQVGKDRLQEFYYRVLPELMDNPFVTFEDHCSEEASAWLPPEPAFTFYMDMAEDSLVMRGEVKYAEQAYPLIVLDKIAVESKKALAARKALADQKQGAGTQTFKNYHDWEQEARVIGAVMKWLPDYNAETGLFSHPLTDDYLYDFLTVGLGFLEYYGTVKGTAAFRARNVLPQPQIQVGISVDAGNLLNISLTSKDLTPKQLMEIYDSYTKKKRYYRLKSGDYIDLTQDSQLEELKQFFGQLDLTPMDVIKSRIQIPVFRALYLDRMLEEHDRIASTRDRTYRALIRSFKTIRDAEIETPSSLEEVLRPYQTYGYKWLKTLQMAGFGGILADEMGLGKTLQMIAIFQADKEAAAGSDTSAGEGPAAKDSAAAKGSADAKDSAAIGHVRLQASLVICPASLVYNWQEEIARFAPDLRTTVLAGTAGTRKKALAAGDTDVFITSYDLLKRDITLYEQVQFTNCVLDEAQYIKNAKSAAAKSVKLIHAQHRFALTGTPIENRLSELWSIFDYLMPGFLYTHADFEKRYELPITKQKDEQVTAKLKAMTAPFILRRKKEDVLKDLPAKMEEVRYARLAGEQQHIYDAQVVRMKGMLEGEAGMQEKKSGEEKIRIFAELTRIRQICCDPSLILEGYTGESAKREACLDLIQSAIEGGHRMLVFSQFVTMLELLEKDLDAAGIPYYKIIGATPKEKRIALVRDFNEGDVPVFLISLKAGGTGLNLTGADVVIHYDPWWNLAAQNQATDRAHRIGQTRQVTVFKLILKDTIEERIMALQDAKKDLAEAILEGDRETLMSMSAEELLALLG